MKSTTFVEIQRLLSLDLIGPIHRAMRLFCLYALIITIFNFSFASPTPNPIPEPLLSKSDMIEIVGVGGLVTYLKRKKAKETDAARERVLEEQKAQVEAAQKEAAKAKKEAKEAKKTVVELRQQVDKQHAVLTQHSEGITRALNTIGGPNGDSGLAADLRHIKALVGEMHNFAFNRE